MMRAIWTCGVLSSLAWALQATGQSGEESWDQAELERRAAKIIREVSELRGLSFRSDVGVQFSSADEFRDYMDRMEAELLPADYADASVLLTKAVGVLPAELDVDAVTERMLAGMVGGFYDPVSKAFYLAAATPVSLAPGILAHELTHALDDQYFDLNEGLKSRLDGSDGLLAYKAVVEGSGLNFQLAWQKAYGGPLDMAGMAAEAERSMEALAGVPTPLWLPLVWTYTGGADFLVQGQGGTGQVRQASSEDVDRAFRRPPTSTEQVLHPEKYWDPEQRDEPVPVTFAVGELPQGWSVRCEDTFGELGLALLTMPLDERDPIESITGLARPVGNEFARGWGGDRAILFERDNGELIAHLATVWDSPRDAGEFYARLLTLEDYLVDNAAQLAPDGGRQRARFDLSYGPGESGVRMTIRIGSTSSQERKVLAALTQGP